MMKTIKILILNGPNLNLLGRREPGIYGTRCMEEVMEELRVRYPQVELEYAQSNHEGELIDHLHRVGFDAEYAGVVLNAGGYTHTSVAIGDAIRAIATPVVEVHVSNVWAREEVRGHSMISAGCRGVIAGFGVDSYRLAIEALTTI